ncbi:unnamed protein product [Paramecium primaurelia]|uniref:Chromo domain-containing protein n=1 Tax=Paramecium primaurelia TaxID=5886 RepID=A0A8S1QCI1_PARPR|nr:unnamed protein product [Paramecium primaurelia]
MSDCHEKEFNSDDSNIYDVEFVYGKKMFKKKIFYAVKWLGWTIQQMSWEPISNFTLISSYLVKRLETKLCYALYYKKIAPISSGIRVHIKGKFCQVQQVYTKPKQKTIISEKQIVSRSIDASYPCNKAQKIITQTKQNFMISNNNNKIYQKIQKKENKSKKHFRKILNQQDENEIISITSLSPIQYEIPYQIKKRRRQNKNKISDFELEKDIQLLKQNEQQTKKFKQNVIQIQQIQIQKDNLKNNRDKKEIQQQNSNNLNFCECQIILNDCDNSESVQHSSKDIKLNRNQENSIIQQQRNSKFALKNYTHLEFSNIQNLSNLNVQETLSQPQEESFEIDLLSTENNEQQQKPQKLNDQEKSKDIHQQNLVSVSTYQPKNQFLKVRVVKSVLNSKITENITQENSDINFKIKKQFISEIMEEEQKRQTEIMEKFPLKQFLYKETKVQPIVKTSQQLQQEIQKLQLEKLALNRTSRCSILVIPKFKDAEIQYIQNNFLNNDIIQYDMDFHEVIFRKIIVENIESHNFLIGKLLFRCIYDNGMEYYVEYDILKRYCPTLLLDYMIVNSILI